MLTTLHRYNASWNVTNKDGMLPVHLSQYSEVLLSQFYLAKELFSQY